MSDRKKTLGQAIDDIVMALSGLEESTQIIAIKAVCEQLSIRMYQEKQNNGPRKFPEDTKESPAIQPPKSSMIITDIREIKKNKQPGSAIEMACLVAYYLENHAPENEQKETINSKDIKKYFNQAGYPLPKVINQVLIDSKASGYFDSPTRGQYKLNPVGHNLVAYSLPRNNKTDK